MRYLDTVKPRTREYFNILEPNYPLWLDEYIDTPELLKQQYISVTCGTIYSDLFESSYFFSSLDHSIAVALIIWRFTHDKEQTLAGLFHDIATPAFKHCIDFLNGDYMTQESTEDLTCDIIKNSSEIMKLLERDNIKLESVCDYHIYPIADNDTPMLSSDRLEYSLSNGLLTYDLINTCDVKEMIDDISIQKNELGEIELGFNTKKIARNFVNVTSKLSILYREDRTRYSMQLIADILKKLNEDGLISISDLYNNTESDIIKIIESSCYGDIFRTWKNAKKVNVSKVEPEDVYYVCHGAKVRYIDPLVNGCRISKICKIAKKMIDKNLSYDMSNYVYLDFKF